jgi:hypothetical protein
MLGTLGNSGLDMAKIFESDRASEALQAKVLNLAFDSKLSMHSLIVTRVVNITLSTSGLGCDSDCPPVCPPGAGFSQGFGCTQHLD